jgi:hypothetical protein
MLEEKFFCVNRWSRALQYRDWRCGVICDLEGGPDVEIGVHFLQGKDRAVTGKL